MTNEKVRVKNNAGKIIEVSRLAWDVLYSKREGFSIYKETKKTDKEPAQEKEKTGKKEAKTSKSSTTTKKRGRPPKKEGGKR